MRFVDHPAAPALVRDAQEARAVGARPIHVVIDQRARRVADPESGAAQTCDISVSSSWPAAPGPRRSSKSPTCASAEARNAMLAPSTPRTSMTSSPWSTIGRSSHTAASGADLGRRILGRQDTPLHRGEFGMPCEKPLDLVEVVRRGHQVVVEAYDYVAAGLPDGHVLDAAFARARVVQMLAAAGRSRAVSRARACRFRPRRISRAGALAAAPSCGARLSSRRASASGRAWVAYYDRELQNNFSRKQPANTRVRAIRPRSAA